MKQFFAFLLLTVLFSSCDDGDLSQISFEFNDTPAIACSNTTGFFIYKTQDKRALIIQLPETSFANLVTADLNSPLQPLSINGSNIRLIYREYSNTISSSTICSSIPAAEPVVLKEYEASEGKIYINTTAIKSEPDANGATKITQYLHTLTFTDLKFELDDTNSQINEAFTQVTYLTTATPFTNFSGETGLFTCEGDNSFFYKFNPTQAMVLDLNEADANFLFTNEAGTKTKLLSNESKLFHLFFDTNTFFLTNDYFCTNPTPPTPPIVDAYTSQNGIEGESGIVEVTSLASDNGFKHTIKLKNVILVKGSLKIQLGNEFILGEFETSN
ncbi:hypothetical protein [Flavobacterium sp.]|uniref:hypothetical protein n=1 Tax=Flavobacterium sp. TaxID=239 RepID=UPI002610C8D7|nr:hypothetical protein [Flavobacterium sp.]MDD3003836.1 hypothetical protein [Flavobacterium sp.]